MCYVNLLHSQYKTWTADWEHRQDIKCGLRTEYKTRTRYKPRTTDCVYENSFRKVKLRERESGLAKTVVPPPCLTHKHSFSWSRSLFSPASFGEENHTVYGQGRLYCYSGQLKLNSDFYKKKDLEKNQFIVLNQ